MARDINFRDDLDVILLRCLDQLFDLRSGVVPVFGGEVREGGAGQGVALMVAEVDLISVQLQRSHTLDHFDMKIYRVKFSGIIDHESAVGEFGLIGDGQVGDCLLWSGMEELKQGACAQE